MKARSIFVLLVLFAVMAVPALGATNNAEIYHSYDGALADLTGNGYPGSLSGTTSIDTSTFKVGNGSLYFDANSANALAMNNYSSTMATHNAGTISYWLRPNAALNDYFLGIGGVSDSSNRYENGILTNGSYIIAFRGGSSTPQWQAYPTAPSVGTWQLLTITQDGTNAKIYIDGTLERTISSGAWFNDMTALNRVILGNRAFSLSFDPDVYIDEFAYYDYALNSSQVAELYNGGAGFNPYASTGPTSFNITASNAETASAINTFNVTLNGTVYSTTNGTIIVNQSGFYNTVIESDGYITVTTSKTYAGGSTTQWNLTSILRNVTVTAVNGGGSPLSNFNVSINGTPYNVAGSSDVFELDRTVLHNFTFTKTDYYSDVQTNVNVTSNVEGTLNYAFVNTTFTAQDETSASLSDFNVTIGATTYNIAGASGTIELDSRVLFNAEWSKTNYLPFTATNLNPNSSQLGNLTEYFNILVYTNFTSGNASYNATTANAEFYHSYDGALKDLTGNGYPGTLSGTTSIDTSTFKVGNGSLYFDANTANSLAMNNYSSIMATHNAGTVAYWLNPQASLNDYFLGFGEFGGSNNRFENGILSNGSYIIALHANSGTATWNAYPTAPSVGTWQHLVITQDGTNAKIYIDGTLERTISSGAWFNDMTALDRVILGNRATSLSFDPDILIDEFAYYDYALNSSQVSELYNNGTGFNPYAGGATPGTPVFTTTDQYNVNWNGTTYYPQADNVTYLPVRYSLENFTVNPTTPAFKQAVYTNYNTTTHLNLTFNNSHAVTATNRYNSSAINTFTVETPTQNYTSINGTAYLQNDTGVITYTVSATDYFDAVNAGVDVTNGSSSVLMHQVEVRFNGTQRFTNNTVADGNVTIGATKKAFGEPFYLNAGTYEAVYTSSNDEAKPLNFTYTALQNVTSTITNITNANLTITGINAVDGSPITFFTTVVNNSTLSISLNKTEASPHLYNLIQNVTYNVVFDNSTFALNDTNITLTNRSTSYTFYVYTTNSFNISILNELTKNEINNTNFTVEFIGSYASYNYTYENGLLYADLIVPDQYQIRYQWINTTSATDYGQLRQYHYILTNRTYNPLDLFALNQSESTEIEITVQNGNTLLREEGVIVKLQRFYIDTNSYETVAMYETDSQGKAHFDVEANNELYKFVIDSPLGTSVYTSTPQYIQETEYTIFIDTSEDPIASYTNNAGLTVTFTVTNTTATATYNDPSATADEYEFTVFERGPYTDTQVSTATATSTSGALVNTYAFEEGKSYYGVLYRDSVAEATADFIDFKQTNGLPALGLFLTSILFVVAVFISAFSLYSVIIASIALVASNMIGLITISTPVIGAVVVGAIILAIILEWRRG